MSALDRHIERMACTGSTGSMAEWCAFTDELATLRSRAEAAEARVAELEAERDAMRGVVEAAGELLTAYADADDKLCMGEDPLCAERVSLHVALNRMKEQSND